MPSVQNRFILGAGALVGVLGGAALAYWKPDGPLLAFWLSLALVLGLWISLTSSLSGLRQRAQWLIALNALVVFFALLTSQVAARRAISATHLRYEGVLLESVDKFTIGSGEDGVDVRLPALARDQIPWSVRVARTKSGCIVDPIGGVEELRVGVVGSDRDYRVSRSTLLAHDGDAAAIVDANGRVVDSIRRATSDELRTHDATYRLDPVNGALDARYGKRLRSGVALSDLDGARSSSTAYERFVRVRALPREIASFPLLGGGRYQVTASPPFGIRGAGSAGDGLTFADSATVEIRQGDIRWRFILRKWRGAPRSSGGLAVFFARNPRPLDTPLPAGINCPANAACGAISLRRLPPPVAHIALDEAGFDTDRFGLLGVLARDETGITIRLPSESYHVDKSGIRPVAVPVRVSTDTTPPRSGVRGGSSYWVLLGASGAFGGELSAIVLIGIGLGLLLLAVRAGVSSAKLTVAGASGPDDRVLAVGITAILGLLVTRLVIGARVAFFAPFLERGVETAVGMWVAVSVVVLGLLTWSAWVPGLLTHARMLISGRTSPGTALRRVGKALDAMPSSLKESQPLLLAAGGCAALAFASPAAVWKGFLAGGMVLLAWVTVAWVAAFAGPFFETFERGAWSVVEQLAPERDRKVPLAAVPELWLILACFSAELALKVPLAAGSLAVAALVAVAWKSIQRWRSPAQVAATPDAWGAAVGAAFFTLSVAIVAATSENGSMAAFVLVVFVALASVRVGRAINARMRGDVPRHERYALTALLLAPFVLLLPLALIDMGLFLVVVLPIGFATVLATGWKVVGRALVLPGLAFAVLFYALFVKVLFPTVDRIRTADTHLSKASAFDAMSRIYGVRLPFVSGSMDRVAARALATRNSHLAEEVLVSANPGSARELLVPSIEQIWGARAYASAGPLGQGLGRAVVGGRGVAEAVSYAENTYSVFLLAEHGAVGGLIVLLLYLLLTLAAALASMRAGSTTPASHRASRALFIVAALLIVIPASYVALSNLGMVPITGQNMPFLGLNSWSDVALVAGAIGIIITGAMRRAEELA